jgi:hypothetical protein
MTSTDQACPSIDKGRTFFPRLMIKPTQKIHPPWRMEKDAEHKKPTRLND